MTVKIYLKAVNNDSTIFIDEVWPPKSYQGKTQTYSSAYKNAIERDNRSRCISKLKKRIIDILREGEGEIEIEFKEPSTKLSFNDEDRYSKVYKKIENWMQILAEYYLK